MVVPRLAWLILIYVTLDFANPLMPGAVNFDAEDSVDGVHAERVRADRFETINAVTPALFHAAIVESERISRPVVALERSDREPSVVRRTPARPPEPASPGDDH
jgi:hypothetical protein